MAAPHELLSSWVRCPRYFFASLPSSRILKSMTPDALRALIHFLGLAAVACHPHAPVAQCPAPVDRSPPGILAETEIQPTDSTAPPESQSTRGEAIVSTPVRIATYQLCSYQALPEGGYSLVVATDLVGYEEYPKDGQMQRNELHSFVDISCDAYAPHLEPRCEGIFVKLNELEQGKGLGMSTIARWEPAIVSLKPSGFRVEVGPVYGGVNLVMEGDVDDMWGGRVFIIGRTGSTFGGVGSTVSLEGRCLGSPDSPPAQ